MGKRLALLAAPLAVLALAIPAGAATPKATGSSGLTAAKVRVVKVQPFHTTRRVPMSQVAGVHPNGDRFECTSDNAGLQGLNTYGWVVWSYSHSASWCVDLNKATIAPHAPEVNWHVNTHWGWGWDGTLDSRTDWAGGNWPYVYKDYRQGSFHAVFKGLPINAYPTLSRCYYWNASAHHC